VIVEEVGRFSLQDLRHYVGYSGFASLDAWHLEVFRLNKGKLPEKGWLYKVTLVQDVERRASR